MAFRQICLVMFLRSSGKLLNTLMISKYISFMRVFNYSLEISGMVAH